MTERDEARWLQVCIDKGRHELYTYRDDLVRCRQCGGVFNRHEQAALAKVERPAQDAPAVRAENAHVAAPDVMDRLRNAQLYNALRMESDTRTWSATDWFLAGTQVGRADERRARAALGEEAK